MSSYTEASGLCSDSWHKRIWRQWKYQVDVDIPRTFRDISDKDRKRVIRAIRIFSSYFPCGYYQGLIIWAMPLHSMLQDDSDAFWATVHFFEILKRYYGPVINVRSSLDMTDARRVVRFYSETCRCNKGEITRLWAARAVEFVHWRILAVVGLSFARDIKSASLFCRFFIKHVRYPRKFRRKLCALAYCILAGLYGRCTKTTCNCSKDCTFYEKLSNKQIKAVLQNVDFMSTLF